MNRRFNAKEKRHIESCLHAYATLMGADGTDEDLALVAEGVLPAMIEEIGEGRARIDELGQEIDRLRREIGPHRTHWVRKLWWLCGAGRKAWSRFETPREAWDGAVRGDRLLRWALMEGSDTIDITSAIWEMQASHGLREGTYTSVLINPVTGILDNAKALRPFADIVREHIPYPGIRGFDDA